MHTIISSIIIKLYDLTSEVLTVKKLRSRDFGFVGSYLMNSTRKKSLPQTGAERHKLITKTISNK